MRTTILTLFLALSLTACGIHVSSDPLKVEGNVTHTVTVNATDVEQVLKLYCQSKYQDQTSIDQCVSEQLALFWNALNYSVPAGSVNPAPSPTPSSGG